MTLSHAGADDRTRDLPDELRPPGPDPHRPGGHQPPAADRHDAVGPAPVPGGGRVGDDAGRLHLAAAGVPAGPARKPAGPGRGADDAGPAAPADPPPVGGDRHHRPACRPGDGPGEDGGGSGLPQPPEWVQGVPVVGAKVAAAWADTAQAGPDGLVARLAPHASDALAWVLGQRRQRGRPAGPLPPGRDPLRDPVRRRRNGGERGAPFRPATGGRARRELRRPGRAGHSGRRAGGRRDGGRPDGARRHRAGGRRGSRWPASCPR